MPKTYYTVQGAAGLKLLITAMRKNIERVQNRYRNSQTREACQALSNLCDGMWEAVTNDRPFTLYIGTQMQLDEVQSPEGEQIPFYVPEVDDFEGTDLAYSQVD